MERTELSTNFKMGDKLPSFKLKATNSEMFDSSELSGKPSVIFFTCNHCPYVKGSEDALVKIANQFSEVVNFVGINSNDSTQYPEDSFDKMVEKVKTYKLPYTYLHDEDQMVAQKFDAACTPEFYLFNSKLELVYHGTINNSPRDPSAVVEHYLEDAINQVLQEKKCSPEFVHPIGCSIKWTQK